MASEVDISNLALAHLGDEATVSSINPPEGSAQAEHCARYYPMARNTVLESHAWNCATKRKPLVELAAVTPPASWAFAYAVPNGCLRVLAVLPDGAADDAKTEDFEQEVLDDGSDTKVIYTNVEDAIVRFIALVEDTTRYSQLMINAIARLMASYLAGPVIKGETGMRVSAGQLKWYTEVDLPKAQAADANARQSEPYKDFVPASITARA